MFLISIIDLFFQVFLLMLLIRILSSWVPELSQYSFVRFVTYYTDPYLNLFRRLIPPIGMLDFSPIVAFLSLGLIENLLKTLVSTLF